MLLVGVRTLRMPAQFQCLDIFFFVKFFLSEFFVLFMLATHVRTFREVLFFVVQVCTKITSSLSVTRLFVESFLNVNRMSSTIDSILLFIHKLATHFNGEANCLHSKFKRCSTVCRQFFHSGRCVQEFVFF